MRKLSFGLVLLLGVFLGNSVMADMMEMKYGVQGYVGGGLSSSLGYPAPAVFVMDVGKDLELNLGLGMRQAGSSVDTNTTIYLEGKWYMSKVGGVMFGPALGFLNGSFANGASKKSSDNNASIITLGATAKKMLWENAALKLDVYALQLISGQSAGSDIKDINGYLPAVSTSIILYFL